MASKLVWINTTVCEWQREKARRSEARDEDEGEGERAKQTKLRLSCFNLLSLRLAAPLALSLWPCMCDMYTSVCVCVRWCGFCAPEKPFKAKVRGTRLSAHCAHERDFDTF